MEKIIIFAERLDILFSGLKRAYGTYHISGIKNGKQTGEALTVIAPVTPTLWQEHLDGNKGLGIVPINDASSCFFGAIDIDQYEGLDLGKIATKIIKRKLPLIPCRSKSGGLHLFLFLKELTPASQVKAKLSSIAATLGFAGAEIFPKQGQVLTERGDIGNWINMPYFEAVRTTRYMVAPDGSPVPLEVFLEKAEAGRVLLSEINVKGISPADLSDGPPCLEHMIEEGIAQGMRNEVLANIAKYLKKAIPDNWRSRMEEINKDNLHPSLLSEELKVIIKSIGSKDYFYSCNKVPLKGFCDRITCKSRKYGCGNESDFPVLTGLVKYDTLPPTWFVEVEEGGRVELTTEDLQNQIRFQRRCIETLNIMPPTIKPEQWRSLLQLLLEKLAIITVPRDASSVGQLLDFLEAFCTSKVQARVKEEILLGKPWLDAGFHYFRMGDFLAYLERHKFRELKVHKIAQILKIQGGKHDFINLRGKGVNVWAIAEFKRHDEKPLDEPKIEDQNKI